MRDLYIHCPCHDPKMNYQSLTSQQRAQVAYLFADDVFGADPSAYEYEVNGGMVAGRTAISDQRPAVRKKPHNIAAHVTVRETPEAYVTTQAQRETDLAIQSIARSVVERIIKSQNVEA